MKRHCDITGILADVVVINATVNVPDHVNYDIYDGDYTIIPSIDSQVLATANKLMQSDLTVTEIPYFETSNPSGTTVYIANSLGE